MKSCTKCKQMTKLEDFYNDKKTFDGKHRQCKSCMTKYDKLRQR